MGRLLCDYAATTYQQLKKYKKDDERQRMTQKIFGILS
jgi:hypothetical protein